MNVWDRQEGESSTAYKAFLDYAAMPVPRSIRDLHAGYLKRASSDDQAQKPPTTKISSLFTWSDRNGWVKRADAYDAHLQAVADAAKEAEIQQIMHHRYANDYERVKLLDEVAQEIRDATKDKANVWLKTTRRIGSGQNVRVEVEEKYNSAIFDNLFTALDHIAKEKGERVKKSDITSNGQTIKGYAGFDTEDV